MIFSPTAQNPARSCPPLHKLVTRKPQHEPYSHSSGGSRCREARNFLGADAIEIATQHSTALKLTLASLQSCHTENWEKRVFGCLLTSEKTHAPARNMTLLNSGRFPDSRSSYSRVFPSKDSDLPAVSSRLQWRGRSGFKPDSRVPEFHIVG